MPDVFEVTYISMAPISHIGRDDGEGDGIPYHPKVMLTGPWECITWGTEMRRDDEKGVMIVRDEGRGSRTEIPISMGRQVIAYGGRGHRA